jgi:hypothetical protein
LQFGVFDQQRAAKTEADIAQTQNSHRAEISW